MITTEVELNYLAEIHAELYEIHEGITKVWRFLIVQCVLLAGMLVGLVLL